MKNQTILKNFVLVIVFLSACIFVNGKDTINLVNILNLAEQEIAKEILSVIYQNAGITLNIESFPGERALLLSSKGDKDGETARIFSFGEKNPTLKRVPTSYYYLETMPFYKAKSNIVIKSKEDLKKYQVIIVRGVQHTKDITADLDINKVQVVNDSESMMKMLEAGRGDIAITNTIDGIIWLNKLGYKGIVHSDKPLAKLDLYNYIYIEKSSIISKLDETIKKMKKSGELDKLIKKSEDVYIKSKN